MANFKTVQGILALIDIVDFTKQAGDLGDNYTTQYTKYFQNKIKEIAARWKFQVIKFIGDAALLFGTEPEGILDIMLDLFERDKPEDKYGFRSRFRIVAHSSYFQFQMKGKTLTDVVGVEAIKMFRMEKYANARELLITDSLYPGIQSLLTAKNIQASRRPLEEPLKGFEDGAWFPTFYKLTAAEKVTGPANLLEQRMNELEQEVQMIPVFGNMYPPVPMDNNFINLALLCDEKEPIRSRRKKHRTRLQETGKEEPDMEKWDARDDWMLKEQERTGREDAQRYEEITVEVLYKNKNRCYTSGIIVGLPGAGKTTILRHLAYKEFRANRRRKPGRKKIVLFVPCRDILFYDDWYKKEYGGTVSIEKNAALEYMTRVFLLGSKPDEQLSPEEKVEFRNGVNKVKKTFEENRLTLLVDALDEAPDNESKDRIRDLFLALASKNRLFLTSRPSERVHLQQAGTRNVPMFNVCSLNMEQVREVARHLMKENSPVYKQFDDAIWQEELVVKMAATPMTALLVTAYFQAYGEFDNRFPMYDLLMKFILLKVWEKIKTDAFAYKNLELFFREIKKNGFFEQHYNAGVIYRGLGALCFELFYESKDGKVQRLITETTLIKHFTGVISRHFPYDEEQLKKFVEEWLERFQQDHLLIRAGAGAFVFIHATVMEYLAAFYLVQAVKAGRRSLPELAAAAVDKEEFLELETVPMAAGSDVLTGFGILAALRDMTETVDYRQDLLKGLAIKALAEVEWLIVKMFEAVQTKRLEKSIRETVHRNREAVAWVYDYLRGLLLTESKEGIREMIPKLDRLFKLSRKTLLEEYLDYNSFDRGDEELVGLRKELLFQLVQKEPVEAWFKTHGMMVETFDNVLRLDAPGYHSEDKNFNYYQGLIGKRLAGFFGSPNFKHAGIVTCCAFSLDGRWVVSGSDDNTLKLWDAASGKEIRAFTGHKGRVLSCIFSPDGRRLVSGSSDASLKLWDAASGKEIRAFTGHKGTVWGCTFSPDGHWLVSGSSDASLKLWDAASGKEIRAFTGHKGRVLSCAFSPDGHWFISGSSDASLKLWDVSSGKEIRAFTGHKLPVTSCTFSPDGHRLVSGSSDESLKLWDVESGKEIRAFTGHKLPVASCTFSPDGRRLVSGSSDESLKLWDVESGKEIRAFTGHKLPVTSCALSPNGCRLVSGSFDESLKLWDVESGKEIRAFTGHKLPVTSCTFSPNGCRLVSGSSDESLKLWNVESGKEIRAFTGHKGRVYSCTFSPDGRVVVSGSEDSSLKLWDVESGKEIRAFTGHKGRVLSCTFSPDGRVVVSGSEDGSLKLWDVESGKEIRAFTGHKDYVRSCTFSPDGRVVVSGSDDSSLKLWDVESGKEIRAFTGHKGTVWGCSFSPDGRVVVSGSSDKTLKLWDAETGKLLKSITLPWIPFYVSISPTKPGVVITGNGNGTVTMFDLEAEKLKRVEPEKLGS